MKTKFLIFVLTCISPLAFASCNKSNAKIQYPNQTVLPETNNSIQVALLLDTSNSMDGLIEQAKSRLWNIVNTMTTLKYNGKTPLIEIALYEYGNDGLPASGNYIRQVTPLTNDLDLISEKLFALRTNGGSEYCGAVIADAVKQLKWNDGSANMKLVYIAGNEGFNQGGVSYAEAISDALKKSIYVNTIYCGEAQQGVSLLWKDGADKGQGKYFNIDSNKAVLYVVTPFDVEISKCNDRLNTTYISYGYLGESKKMNQMTQDANAESISTANKTERAISKSKAVYSNDSWDLVDRYKADKNVVANLKKDELPEELKGKSTTEINALIEVKTKEREQIQKEIGELAKKREAYLAQEAKTKGGDDLGDAISQSIVTLAKQKGYTTEKL